VRPVFHGALQKSVAHNDSKRAGSSQVAEAFSQLDDFPKPISAWITSQEMFFHGILLGTRKQGKPVIRERCRIDGTGTFLRGAAIIFHTSPSIH
jgi:hypothetical protein